MKQALRTLLLSLVGSLLFGLGVSASTGLALAQVETPDKDPTQDQLRQEEEEDYYTNWLKRDVIYIITPEEKSVFESLSTDAERTTFIEQFWLRRDSDPRTSINEFKEEHYRRIAYVNERFGSGLPGWRTDRGKTYILHGPPDEIDPHPSGGLYQRPTWEGGGHTSTFPFEIWRYRHIEGLGSDVELEFVDRSFSGEYKLALEPEEKDAFLYVPGLGLTDAERWGLATKAQRPFFDPSNRDYPAYGRIKDEPFERYRLWNRIHFPPALKYPELREIVEVDMSFGRLPFNLRLDYFKLSPEKSLAAISVGVENKDLLFESEEGKRAAKVAVYGLITTMGRKVVYEFDDDLTAQYPEATFETMRLSPSIYQKIISLDAGTKYMLTVVVKDQASKLVGVTKQALNLPAFGDGKLASSSLMLSDSYQVRSDVAMSDEMFVIGDIRIHPDLKGTFSSKKAIGAFFHVYNTTLDQSTLTPSLQIKYEVLKEGKRVLRFVEHNNESLHYFTDDRTVFLKQLPVNRLGPGEYMLKIEIMDRLKEETIALEERFSLDAGGEASQAASNRP